jgi:alpha-tubulin suppressor-like RCC1 family protein
MGILGPAGGATDIAAGAEHTCAVIARGVACWGTNVSGQLGDGTNVSRNRPTDVAGLSGEVNEITAGSEHTCALTQGGAIACWGANFSGQLGDASNLNQKRPVGVPGLPTVSPSVRVRIL